MAPADDQDCERAMSYPSSFYAREVSGVEYFDKLIGPTGIGASYLLRPAYADTEHGRDIDAGVLERALAKGPVYVKLKNPQLVNFKGRGWILASDGTETDQVYFTDN